mmetsp:Transcript_42217/g.55616  ORF Transcript_42217/g.55616 Transcript_42217/m.55616 type:complete len:94 (-) Transcript_42217:1609-1890(-)
MLQYEVLEIIEFSSARKRMTVVVRDLKKGVIKVMTKGADDTVGELLRDIDSNTYEGARQAETRQNTAQSLLNHAQGGLRTLLLAEKTISEQEY